MHVGTDIREMALDDVLMSTLQSKSTSLGSDTEVQKIMHNPVLLPHNVMLVVSVKFRNAFKMWNIKLKKIKCYKTFHLKFQTKQNWHCIDQYN